MAENNFSVSWSVSGGLILNWKPPEGLPLRDVPLRVEIRGENTFRVWGAMDSGEGPPAWAEPGLALTFFGPGTDTRVRGGENSYHIVGVHARAIVSVAVSESDGELSVQMSMEAPVGGRPLPVCLVEIRLEGIDAGADATYLSAHSYGGRTFGKARIAELETSGAPFVHGCIGLALPLVYLHGEGSNSGMQFEFLLPGRPTAWVRPAAKAQGGQGRRADFALTWALDRLLAPGEAHAFGGALRLKPFVGRPVERMRNWRDCAAARFGLQPPPAPTWARRMNIIEFNMNPQNREKDFTRLDDPKCLALLRSWKEMGYTSIFAVSCNHVGQNWLSPFDYDPADGVGGVEAEQQMLRWAHDLGFHIFLWVTTVGIDRDAPEVAAHPDWFTHRPNGKLFYAWDSRAPDYLGYAPDGDPLSTGWRGWLKEQVGRVVGRGYDGVFIDGCIPRASNHARWAWPGESRNGVEDQVRELAEYMRTLPGMNQSDMPALITFVEDESLLMQASCEVTVGRYTAMTPFVHKPFWDHGMGGGPTPSAGPPPRISPEDAREYLLVRYASLLSGVVSNDVLEGYYSEAARPWAVQSLLAGCVPKTHSQFVDDPATFRQIADADPPPQAAREREHRLRGHQEFLNLLKMARDEALIREAPLSIEAVEVRGDAAVVGMLRYRGDRALLALIQFADRAASVEVTLAEPVDAPAAQRAPAGDSHLHGWQVRELLRSMNDEPATGTGEIGQGMSLRCTLAPFGFRLFLLTR